MARYCEYHNIAFFLCYIASLCISSLVCLFSLSATALMPSSGLWSPVRIFHDISYFKPAFVKNRAQQITTFVSQLCFSLSGTIPYDFKKNSRGQQIKEKVAAKQFKTLHYARSRGFPDWQPAITPIHWVRGGERSCSRWYIVEYLTISIIDLRDCSAKKNCQMRPV